MGFEAVPDGDGYRLAFDGVLSPDDMRSGFESLLSAGLGDETPHAIIDFSAAESLDFTIEDHHRMHTHLRMLFAKGRDFRVALIAPSEPVRSQLRAGVEVRDLLTGRSLEALPPVQYFDSQDEARAWLASPKTGRGDHE